MTFKAVRNVLFVATSLVVSAAAGDGPPPTIVRTSQLDQQWLDAVVSIERVPAPDKVAPIGTGFIVATGKTAGADNTRVVLVTAKHVVIDPDSDALFHDLAYRLNFASGSTQLLKEADLEKSGGGSWFLSDKHDLAVRFLPVVEGASVKAIPLDRFVEERQVEAGTPLAALGFPMGIRSVDHAMPIARRGMVGRADKAIVLADLFVFPGNSGGPVLYVPAFKTGSITFGGAEVARQELLVGVVSSFIPYDDVAVSIQTKRPRVVFEENSGLANLVPAWVLREFITTGDVAAFDEKLSRGQ